MNTKSFLVTAAMLAALGGAPVMAQDAPPAPTMDSDGDGTPDAWDRDGDGRADAWDTDGDGSPDVLDQDGDGNPDDSPESM
ncbi:MAG: hypothetical protein AAF205_08945 [Pseudomonadota bacterium]